MLDDGRELETELFWIGVKPGDPGASWLVPSGEWTARTVDDVSQGEVPRGEIGTWAILIDPPIDDAHDQPKMLRADPAASGVGQG